MGRLASCQSITEFSRRLSVNDSPWNVPSVMQLPTGFGRSQMLSVAKVSVTRAARISSVFGSRSFVAAANEVV